MDSYYLFGESDLHLVPFFLAVDHSVLSQEHQPLQRGSEARVREAGPVLGSACAGQCSRAGQCLYLGSACTAGQCLYLGSEILRGLIL